jgi:hypothetical protein
MRPLLWAAVAATALTASACSSNDTDFAASGAPASASSTASEEPSGLVAGGAQPGGKFKSSGSFTAKGTPDLNTVPTTAPTPPSSKEARAQAIEGLIADRANARYTDQGGRTQPVAVRPLVDTPETARPDALARLDAPPPERPVEPALEPLPAPVVVQADVGPQAPGAALRRGPGADPAAGGALTSASLGGFRPLAEFQAAVYSKSSLAGTLAVQGGSLNASDRKVLNTTARQQIDSRGKAVVRVVGHGSGGLDRALLAAKELQRLGVAQGNLYVGVDNVTGPTEVFLDHSK